jgi:hypothetical protein
MQKHYHALYKAIQRAKSYLKAEGYFAITSDLSGDPFKITATNGRKTRYISLVIAEHGKLQDYTKILTKLEGVNLPQASSKELWVWEIRAGWHFYPVNETKE